MATGLMKRAHDILRDAEVRLCELIPKALKARRDEEASRLMELARLLAEARCLRAASQSPARQCSEAAPAGPGSPRGPRPVRKRKVQAAKKASPYPKFLREGDALLKLGWSRKSRSEYEHRAPREAVLAVAERIAEVASRVIVYRLTPPARRGPRGRAGGGRAISLGGRGRGRGRWGEVRVAARPAARRARGPAGARSGRGS